MTKPIIPLITGPTAVGKTDAAVRVCQILDGEIISADSRQIYIGMDIGSAKPPKDVKIKHHLIDILEPDKLFSAGDFVKKALECIEDISSRGKLPVIAGGAGLYMQALAEGIFEGDNKDLALRDELIKKYNGGKAEKMLEELKNLDPEYSRIVHINDRKKIVRFFEIYYTTGKTISELKQYQGGGWIKPLWIGLEMERSAIYYRIERRVDLMMEAGLIKEVNDLVKAGYTRELNSMNSPGYKEIFDFLDRKKDFDETAALIKRNTRRYAKRQITWFKRIKDMMWFKPGETKEIADYIKNKIA